MHLSSRRKILPVTRLQLLYLDLCWGKNTFPPLPLPISAFIQSINFLNDYYVTFFTRRYTNVFLPFFMYPVQMPSLMYLLLKSRGECFLTHSVSELGEICLTLIVLDSGSHSAPFSGAWVKPVPAEMAFTDLFELFGVFLMLSVLAIFSPQMKCISFAVRKILLLKLFSYSLQSYLHKEKTTV